MGNGLRLRKGAVLHKVQDILIYAIQVVIFIKNKWAYFIRTSGHIYKERACVLYSAMRNVRSPTAECMFPTAERTYRSGEYNSNTVVLYIHIR